MNLDLSNDEFDRRLKELMQASADRVGASRVLSRRTTRWIRWRQVVLSMFVLGLAAGTAAAGIRLSGEVSSGRGGPVAEDDAAGSGRGSGGTYPCSYEEFEGSCVATGRWQESPNTVHEWYLGAYVEGSGEVCVEDAVAGTSGSACGPPEFEGFDYSVSGYGGELRSASGVVESEVSRMVLEVEGEEDIDLELYPAPEGLPSELRFFFVFLRPSDGDLVAFDSSGRELSRQPTDIDKFEEESDRKSYVVAEGTSAGVSWRLKTRTRTWNGVELPCTNLTVGEGDGSGGGGGCPPGNSGKRLFGFWEMDVSGHSLVAVHGATSLVVDSVEIHLEDREEPVVADMFDDPTGRGFRYFVAFFEYPQGQSPVGEIAWLGSEGEALKQRPLCAGFLVGGGGICGP